MTFAAYWLRAEQSLLYKLVTFANRGSRKAKPKHLITGERGEMEALFFLRRQGFLVVEKRWTTPELKGDIDLVAWEGDTLCIVEVKTRTARDMTPAASAVDAGKRRMLARMARAYRRTVPREDRKNLVVRCDIVSVYLLAAGTECELLRDVFDLDGDDSSSNGV